MERINHATAVDGLFTDGDPQQGIPATTVTAAHMNAIQEELINLIVEAGLTPDGEDLTQLAQAIAALYPDLLTTANTWTKTQAYAPQVLSISSGVVSWDLSLGPAVLNLTSDVTTLNLSNVVAGATYELTVIQDGTGGRTVAWPSSILWPGGVALEVTPDAGGEDVIMLTARANGGGIVLRATGLQSFAEVS